VRLGIEPGRSEQQSAINLTDSTIIHYDFYPSLTSTLMVMEPPPPSPALSSSSVEAAIVCCFGSLSLERLMPNDDCRNQGIEIFLRLVLGGFAAGLEVGDVGVFEAEDSGEGGDTPAAAAAAGEASAAASPSIFEDEDDTIGESTSNAGLMGTSSLGFDFSSVVADDAADSQSRHLTRPFRRLICD
jgi:hypothetical protein